MYCDPKKLKKEIKASRESGQLSPYVIMVVMEITKGVSKYYRYHSIDMDDLQQDTLIAIHEKIWRFDLRRKPRSLFSYMTTIIHNVIRHSLRKHIGYQEFINEKYRKHLCIKLKIDPTTCKPI